MTCSHACVPLKASGVTEPLHHLAFFSGRLAAGTVEESPPEEFLLAVTAEGGLKVFSLDEGVYS